MSWNVSSSADTDGVQMLPAIHFRVTYLKHKTWEKWKAAMAPALQMKQAREIDRRAVLSESILAES